MSAQAHSHHHSDNIVATVDMAAYCFDVLVSKLASGTTRPTCPSSIPAHNAFPLFVTWKRGQTLRGCIGTFSRLPLPKGLRDYTIASAFEDTRFAPIALEEVPHLQCTVSLLVRFEPARDYCDWQIGVHGIRINFKARGDEYSAVFLPYVAEEHGWDHLKTIEMLVSKSGYIEPIDQELLQKMRVVRFQSSTVTISYGEYLSHIAGVQK